MKRVVKKVFMSLVIVFIILSIIPFLIPIDFKNELSDSKPFAESDSIIINDVYLHYRIWEPEAIIGKALLVHGFGGSTYTFRNNINALLAEGYLVIAVDLPGFGYSDRSRGLNHSQKERSKLLWGLLDSIDESIDIVEKNWHLIGHSMGGGTIVAMGIERANQIASLTLVSGAVLDQNHNSRFLTYPPISRWFQVIYRYGTNEKQIKNLLKSAYGRDPSDEEIQGYLHPVQLNGSSGVLLDMTFTAKNESLNLLKELDIPILAIWGDNDKIVSLEQAYTIKDIISHVQLHIISNAGHCTMETHYEEFNETLLYFLKQSSKN